MNPLGAWCFLLASAPLAATPAWKAPPKLALGELAVIELREDDPSKPALPRPGDDRLGPLPIRAAEPTADGRGWRLTVQPLEVGVAVISALDLGDGRRTPELRIPIPRTVPKGAPWMGFGGGREDELPRVPFPWLWALPLLLPIGLPIGLLVRHHRHRAGHRIRKRARHAFLHAWPPRTRSREALDQSHAAGRDFLAACLGAEARTWGQEELLRRNLPRWATWSASLDAARFGKREPAFPEAPDLLRELEGRP